MITVWICWMMVWSCSPTLPSVRHARGLNGYFQLKCLTRACMFIAVRFVEHCNYTSPDIKMWSVIENIGTDSSQSHPLLILAQTFSSFNEVPSTVHIYYRLHYIVHQQPSVHERASPFVSVWPNDPSMKGKIQVLLESLQVTDMYFCSLQLGVLSSLLF